MGSSTKQRYINESYWAGKVITYLFQKKDIISSNGHVLVDFAASAFNRVNPFHTTTLYGVPASFNRSMTVTRMVKIIKGQLNKPVLFPRIINEHCESSRQVTATVNATTIVAQIIKVSKDNISGLALTLESAEGVQVDNFESYANSAALQTVWIENTNQATLETTTVKGGLKAMALPGDVLGDEWVKTIAPTSFLLFTWSFDAWFTKDFNKFKVSFFIGDGVNTKSFQLTFNAKDSWNHFDIDEIIMAEDGAGTTNMAAITQVGFRVDDPDGGEFAIIDNILATPPPGQVEIKLHDMGRSLPVSGVTSIDDGTQYTSLNGSASSVFLDLVGGKRLYHLHDTFTAGLKKNEPGNNDLLTPNNYYLLELKYVDTDVDVYGPDITLDNYYKNGFAMTAATEAGALTAVGDNSDIMFFLQSMQDCYVGEFGWKFDAAPGENADLFVFAEDVGMLISGVIIDHDEQPAQSGAENISDRPIFMGDGSKLESYYNGDFADGVTTLKIRMTYFYEEPQANG